MVIRAGGRRLEPKESLVSDQCDRRATKVRLELRLDPPVAEQLQQLAAKEQRTVSAVAQRLLVRSMTVELKEAEQN